MADPISDNTLSFEEFPPVSTQEWEALIEKDLKGKDYTTELLWKSEEGFEILPFYRQEDLQGLEHDPHPIFNDANWKILEPIDQPTLIAANKQSLNALEHGSSGLILDLPADSIQSKQNMVDLLDQIHPQMISLQFGRQISTIQHVLWLTEILLEQDQDLQELDISFSFDPYSEALLTGTLASKDSIAGILTQLRNFKPFTADVSVYANSGATIVQQLAFALAAGNEYLNIQEDIEMELYEVAAMTRFNFATASSFFPEIAKYRAFRLLWTQVLNAYDDDLSHITPFHIQSESALWNKPSMDGHNNMIRATTETMSAALGGCNYISVGRFDKNWASHSEFSSRIARNTQHILQKEAYLNKVADAAAGSYYIEKLTDNIALQSWKLFQEIEKIGGLHAAIKDGMIQELIADSRDKKLDAYRSDQETLIGLNKFTSSAKPKPMHAIPGSSAGFFGGEENVDKIRVFNIENELMGVR